MNYYWLGYKIGLWSKTLDMNKINKLDEPDKQDLLTGYNDGKYDWEHLFIGDSHVS